MNPASDKLDEVYAAYLQTTSAPRYTPQEFREEWSQLDPSEQVVFAEGIISGWFRFEKEDWIDLGDGTFALRRTEEQALADVKAFREFFAQFDW